MSRWFDNLIGLRRWAKNAVLNEPSVADADTGLSHLGQATPTFGLHDAMFQWDDDKINYLFQQLKSLAVEGGKTFTETDFTTIREAVKAMDTVLKNDYIQRIADEATARSNTDSQLSQSISDEATTRNNIDTGLQTDYNQKLATKVRSTSGNSLGMGWDGAGLTALVDSTSMGRLWSQFNVAFANQSPGYIVFPNGFKICWGKHLTTGSITNVSFPIAFSATPLAISVIEAAAEGTWYSAVPTLYAVDTGSTTATNLRIAHLKWNGSGWIGANNDAFNYIAMGV